jgi:hypothetical protein
VPGGLSNYDMNATRVYSLDLNADVGQTVAGTVVSVTIQCPQFTTVDGTYAAGLNMRIVIGTDGALSYRLMPNIGIQGVFYTVIYQIVRPQGSAQPLADTYSEQIIVPISDTAVTLASCRTTQTLTHTSAS